MEIEYLKSILIRHNCGYVPIKNEHSLLKIYELFKNETMFFPQHDYGIECFYIALFYYFKKDLINTEKYYLDAIKHGQVDAMHCYADLLSKYNKFENAEKYYKMAINHGYIHAINNLAALYSNKKDFVNAEKYYKLAIEKGLIISMYNLAGLYVKKGDLTSAKNYLLMFEENITSTDPENLEKLGNTMIHLATVYEIERDNLQAQRYYLKAMEYGNIDAVRLLISLYLRLKDFDNAEKFLKMLADKDDEDAILFLIEFYNNKGDTVNANLYQQMVKEH